MIQVGSHTRPLSPRFVTCRKGVMIQVGSHTRPLSPHFVTMQKGSYDSGGKPYSSPVATLCYHVEREL